MQHVLAGTMCASNTDIQPDTGTNRYLYDVKLSVIYIFIHQAELNQTAGPHDIKCLQHYSHIVLFKLITHYINNATRSGAMSERTLRSQNSPSGDIAWLVEQSEQILTLCETVRVITDTM